MNKEQIIKINKIELLKEARNSLLNSNFSEGEINSISGQIICLLPNSLSNIIKNFPEDKEDVVRNILAILLLGTDNE